MKKTLLVISLCINVILSFSQTKKETIDWLTFYLEKYNTKKVWNYTDGRSGLDQSFYFTPYSLANWQKFTHYDKFGLHDSVESEKTASLDLSQLINVAVNIDTSNEYATPVIIQLSFKENWNRNGKAVIIYDDLKKQNANKASQFQFGYGLEFYDTDILKDDMANRIKKALEHLATLEGAHLIKEVF